MTRLRKMMLEELQRRNYSQSTTTTYIRTVEDFARYFKRRPDQLGPEHIREYQAQLFSKRKLAPNTVTQRGGLSDFPFHLRSTCPSVWGFADLHTHPATHLAFGADGNGNNGLIWGKPAHDGGLDDFTSMLDQNLSTDMAACPQGSFGPIGLGFTHNNAAGLDFVTTMTDALIVSELDGTSPGYTHQAMGWPTFGTPQAGWPAALTVDHQVMHIDNIKSAFQGGLRLLFAAATDDELISDVCSRLWAEASEIRRMRMRPMPAPSS